MFIFMVSISASLLSCQRFIQGEKQKEQVIVLSNAKFNCLKKVPEGFKNYSLGKDDSNEIEKNLDCLQSSFKYFTEKTKGESIDSYKIEELRSFFGKYFLKENEINDSFLFELMKFKKAIIGGNERIITKAEIKKMDELFEVLKKELKNLQPYIQILTLRDIEAAPTEKEIIVSAQKLNQLLKSMVKKTEISNSDYSLVDSIAFIEGLGEFIAGNQKVMQYSQISNWLPLIKEVKIILFGHDLILQNLSDWNLAIDTLTDSWSVFVKLNYKLNEFTFKSKQNYSELIQWGIKTLKVIEKSPRMRHEGGIQFNDIDKLIIRYYNANKSFLNLKLETVLLFYPKIILKFFSNNEMADLRSQQALKIDMIRALEYELKSWYVRHTFLEQSLANAAQLKKDEFLKKAQSQDIEKNIKLLAATQVEKDLLKSDLTEMMNFFVKKDMPLLDINFNFKSARIDEVINSDILFNFNLIFTISELFLKAYGDSTKKVMNANQLSRWFEDFNQLGVELNLFDSRSANPSGRSFLEGNLFTMHGNGDEELDQVEIFELISNVTAGGSSFKSKIRLFVSDCEINKKDHFGRNYLNEICFRSKFLANFTYIYSHLPNWVRFFSTLSLAQKEWLYYYLVNSTRVSIKENGLIEDADLRALSVVSIYVDNLFNVYDLNRNGLLDEHEVQKATIRFEMFFKKLKPELTKEQIAFVFSYLLVRGEKPSEGFFSSKVDYISHQFDDFNVSPMSILKVLDLLKADLNQVKK